MDKPIRKAVRCYLIKDNEVVVTKYKKGNKKEGYYDRFVEAIYRCGFFCTILFNQ